MDHGNEPKPEDIVTTDDGGIEIEELEDKEVPFDWICVTSSSCKCTSTSCAGWAS